MKNNFQSNVNGQMLDGGSIEHPLSIHSASIGTRWKPRGMQLICTLVLLFAFATGNVWAGVITAAASTDLGSGKTPRHVVEQSGVGRLMKNATGSSSWTLSNSKYLQTGSSKFALQTYNEISSIVITGYGTGSNRTFSSIKVGTTTSNYAAASATGSGTMSSTESAQTITITPSSNIAANSYVEITLSGNINIASVELVEASAASTDPVSSVTVSGATAGYATVPVELTATPDETATAYKWFVDGVEQSGQTSAKFNFTAAAPGTYSIVAQARNDYNEAGAYISSSAHSITVGKLCGELIKIVQNGQSDGTVSGILTGTKDVKLSSGTSEYDSKTGRKIGSDNYWLGITNLSSTLRAGDVVSVFVTTTSANLILYSDKGSTKIGEKIGGVVQGENQIVLNSNATGKSAIYLYRVAASVDEQGGGNMNPYVHSLAVTRSCEVSTDCEMKSLTINGDEITPVNKVYSYEVAAASALTQVAVAYTIHPLATGSPASGFNVAVPAAGDPANMQTITVTAEDGTHSDTYTVSVSKATAASDVVTLDALGVTGYTLSPAFAAATTAYTITKAYGAEDPGTDKVTYTKTEEAQDVDVAYDGTNHTLTVTVTAEDNTTTQDYVITINEAAAKRDLLEVVFSNGAKGAINASSKEIRVPYIGADAPTFVSAAFADWVEAGASAEMNEGKLKVIGADSNFDEYTITPVQLDVTGVALGEDITFDAVPAYIFAPYGWDSGKGVKFAKNYEQESNRRISSGNSRIYIAVPTGVATLQLTSGSAGARNVVIKVNGGTSTITKTAAANSAIDLAMNPAIVNFVYIENNTGSSGGDAGFIKMHLVPAYSVTYDAGAGAVKGGETMPTQVAVAAGTEITLASGDALEKDGYDFDGWLCDIDAEKYAAGAAYTMTAAATTFTAQWVEHIVPVDPTLTYNDGAYTTGLAALDLSTLIDEKQSTGAITYSVKEANGTGAAIDGVNFTATAAGTAVITASQAAVVGFNAKSVDFNVVVTEPTEVDGIKMVVNNALTGNFISARTLNNGTNVVEGITYTKYITMSSTMSSFGNEVAPSATKGIYYYPSHKNIRFYFYVYNNQSSAKKIYIYTVDEDAEGTSDATSANVSVEAGRHMVYADVELTKHAAVVFGVENTGMQICQIVAVESGAALLQGGEAGYSIDYNKCYISPKKNTVAVYDGIEYKLYDDAKLVSASNVQLKTLGTDYIKFHLDATMQVKIYADNKKYYIGSECSTEDAAKLYEATGNGEFTLAAGDWYINGSGAQVKINKLEFALPKAETPTITTQPATKLTFDPGDMTATVVATVTEGTLHYQWYKKATVGDDEEVGTDAATLTTTTEGTYYVVVTNTLAGHQDVSVTSEEAELGYRVTNDATLMALSYGGTAITLEDGVYNYNVELAKGTTDVPALAATATMDGYADVDINDAAEFVNYEASSTVTVKSEDLTETNVYTVNFYVKHDLPQVDVTATTTWDMANVSASAIELTGGDKNARMLLANIDGVNNNASFNSQALYFEGQHIGRKQSDNVKHLAGRYVQFNVTVPGAVFVTFASNGDNARTISINGKKCARTTSGTAADKYITYALAVEPGSVEIIGYEGESANQYIRISKIEFKAEYSYHRENLNPAYLGTLCWTNDAVLGGATLYEFAGKNENNYLVFDEVAENRLEAGKPYIFMPENGNTEIKLYNTDNEAALTEDQDPVNNMYGTLTGKTLVPGQDDNMYYFSASHIWAVKDFVVDINVPAYYCYVDYVAVLAGDPAPAPAQGRRRVTMGTQGSQVATGMDAIKASDKPMKLLINGQIFILCGEKMYDATGRLVK